MFWLRNKKIVFSYTLLSGGLKCYIFLSSRPVKVIRLVGKNTVEEIILKRAEEKLKLTEKVIEEGQFSLGLSKQAMITDEKVKVTALLYS